MQFLAFVLATVIPIAVLFAIHALDQYGTVSFRNILLSVSWGVGAFIFSFIINSAVYNQGLITSWMDVARFVAPPVEEIFKALILVYLVRRPNFTSFVDGAIYGFAVGVGFAVVENFQYILDAREAAFSTAVGRVISTNLIHAAATALVGISLGRARFQIGARPIMTFMAGVSAAVLLHGLFNNLVSVISSGPVLLYAALIALAAVAAIAFMISHGQTQSGRWIEEALGVSDRVTANEARLVYRFRNIKELLNPLRSVLGDAKAAQVRQLLLVQAQLGIQQAAYAKLPGEHMRRTSKAQIEDLARQMDELRRASGSYTMLAVRQLAPDKSKSLWEDLDCHIQENARSRSAAGSINIFANLSQQLAVTSGCSSDTTE